ncbi:HI1506-related protein [Shewanella sp. LZH-2]|uniref:HI1506-related protein n=1 Tax=Shewanella sp. LZH-2 TaxID=2806008 RepID=UPI00193E4D4C|nr:HI1506-related protein [Shewanella sp. LZH-2]QRK80181.1 hypothetical protein JM642_03450 [Shewanella sp. LZH-2]
MAQVSDQTQEQVSVLMVVSRQPNGYRRAGLAFNKGDNPLSLAELSDEQVAAIKADIRFKVFETSMAVDSPGSLDIPNGDTSLTSQDTTAPVPLSFSEAITKLDKANNEHFTSSGKPQCSALEALIGQPISAAERDAQWAAFTANTAGE